MPLLPGWKDWQYLKRLRSLRELRGPIVLGGWDDS